MIGSREREPDNALERRIRSREPEDRLGLVFSGGGARAAYQIGILSTISRRAPDAHFPVITGVSAGAINATFLAGHAGDLRSAIDTLSEQWCSLCTSRIFRTSFSALVTNAARVALKLASGGSAFAPKVHGLVDTEPLRRFLSRVIGTSGIGRNIEAGRLHAAAISATSYHTGQTVTFVQGASGIPMWERVRRRAVRADLEIDHVMASTAIPIFFPARRIGDEYYGDGSIRQSHPMAPAVHLGASRILAISSRHGPSGRQAREPVVSGYPPAAQIIGLLLNSIFLDNLDADAERLKRINLLVSRIPQSKRWLLAQRELKLLVLRPSRDLGRLAAEFEHRMPRSLRYLVRGLGSRDVRTSDLVSYLLFETDYVSRLIRLGEKDAERQWLRIERFLETPRPS
ncbi:MAG: patatin-like phospholipase family protein [Gemmatimonadota bacterium]